MSAQRRDVLDARLGPLPTMTRFYNMTRFHDAMIGGKDKLVPHHALVAEMTGLVPSMPRPFGRDHDLRVLQQMTQRGATPFFDLGHELPTTHNAHQVARRQTIPARVLHVDRDPTVAADAHGGLGSRRSRRRASVTTPLDGLVLDDPPLDGLVLDDPRHRALDARFPLALRSLAGKP